MIDIGKIENDIKHTSEHLELMSKILTTVNIVHDILNNKNVSLAKDFEIEYPNFQYILVLSQFELSLILKAIFFSKSDLEKVHNIKKGLLILYETKVALDKFSPTLKRIKEDFPQFESEFSQTITLIKEVKKSISSDRRIEEIRNNVSAHINPNFLHYYKHIEKIDLFEDFTLLIKMKEIFRKIEDFVTLIRFSK
ncbi:hypothetical protein [Elizabethkingia miricola]|uniref:HEPN AbiU2-like domain-containing protein n=1 Tax=Elizabethkingia miricola TaxID=172045 RepID=A0ABD5B1Q6_ELIMR|nr:hypothetical protein [Elizabethkingia miricola]MDQ8747844.1 hypothetical protein [Elizabethkingia miricola]